MSPSTDVAQRTPAQDLPATLWSDRHQQRRKTLRERFDEKWVEGANGCWIWQAAVVNGYGYLSNRRAHRVGYELYVGVIAADLVLDHLCGVATCVNPDHLQPVTQAENRRRQQQRQTHCRNGHPLSGENLALVRVCRTCRAATERRHIVRQKERAA